MTKPEWCVYDLTNDTVIGRWADISYAEEFAHENEGEDDVWCVFHTDDLIEVPA